MDTEKESSSYGSLISIFIIIIVLIAGAWYVWHKRIREMYPAQIQPTTVTATETPAQ